LELGVMLPIIIDRLILSLKLASEVIENFAINCIDQITVNEKQCRLHLEKSTAYATLLSPVLGYETMSAIVKESLKTGKTIRELVIGKKLLTTKEFDDPISKLLL